MSKTFVANGTGSGQTLSELDSDKIPVYSTEADLDTDLANLADGELALYPSEGAEMSLPVDTVQSGNLHAVTSNAVAQKFRTGVATVDVETGIRQFHVDFGHTYGTKPLVFANIYDTTVTPFVEITGVNISSVTTQGFNFRLYNNYGATLYNINVAWLAIAQ